jgi:hypothetical protein
VIECAARQHEGLGSGGCGESDEHVEVGPAGGTGVGVERGVQITDVAVDRAHAQPGRGHRAGDGLNCGGVEHEGHVVADAG